MYDKVIIAFAWLLFLVLILGYKLVFKPHGKYSRGLNVIQLFFPTSAGVCLYNLATSSLSLDMSTATGVTLLLTSMALFLAAAYASRHRPLTLAFSEDVPTLLMTEGPYQRIRHPFYTSYILAHFGCFFLTEFNSSVLVCSVGALCLYTWAALMEEDKFSKSPLAADYDAYKQVAGMFWPLSFSSW